MGSKLSNDEYRVGWTEEDWQNSPAEFLHLRVFFFISHSQAKAMEAAAASFAGQEGIRGHLRETFSVSDVG